MGSKPQEAKWHQKGEESQARAVSKGAELQHGCLGADLSVVKLSPCPQRLLTAGVHAVAGPVV